VENVIALTGVAEEGEFTFDAFKSEREPLRYRNGINEGYPSRLHYFSDWRYQNQEKKIKQDITQEIGS